MSGLVIGLFLYPIGGHQGRPQTETPRFQRFPLNSLESLQLSLFWVRILVLPYPATPVYISFLSLYCTPLVNHTLYFPSQT